jgi:hypothetical protein
MKWLPLFVVAAGLAGCSGSSDPNMKDPPPQTMLNPSGKPQTQQDQQMADLRGQYGQKQNEEMAAAAAQMAAAKAKAGVH